MSGHLGSLSRPIDGEVRQARNIDLKGMYNLSKIKKESFMLGRSSMGCPPNIADTRYSKSTVGAIRRKKEGSKATPQMMP